jgi:hypothetical protein
MQTLLQQFGSLVQLGVFRLGRDEDVVPDQLTTNLEKLCIYRLTLT